MDFLVQNWFLLATAAISGLLLLWPALSGSTQGISPAEAVHWMNREKAVVIDVSEPAEFSACSVRGSRNLPLGQIEAGAKALPNNKQQPIVLVCARGSRAARAAGAVRKLGHERVAVLSGGLQAWREANLPVQTQAAAAPAHKA